MKEPRAGFKHRLPLNSSYLGQVPSRGSLSIQTGQRSRSLLSERQECCLLAVSQCPHNLSGFSVGGSWPRGKCRIGWYSIHPANHTLSSSCQPQIP